MPCLYTMSLIWHFGCDCKATKDGLLCCCGVCVCRRASRLRNTLLHTSTKLSTKWWSITRTETNEIERPRVDHTYDRMPGIKKTFLFMPIREGVTIMRALACWCSPCMQAWAPGEGTMDSNYVCHECESPQLPWKEMAIGRTDAAGISNKR